MNGKNRVPLLHEIKDPRELVWLDGPLPSPGEGVRLLAWVVLPGGVPPAVIALEAVTRPNGSALHFEWYSNDLDTLSQVQASNAKIPRWAWLQWTSNVIVKD